MPRELIHYWPSLESSKTSPTSAMPVEDFNFHIDQMKGFMNLVVKIAFTHLHYDASNPTASALYDSFFPKKSEDYPSTPEQLSQFGSNIEEYINNHVLAQQDMSNVQEQQDQMNFSALVILFRVLKTIRMQDSLGQRTQQRFLFAVACIAVANQCDNNI